MDPKMSRREHCRLLLDKALQFAAANTDQQGRMVVDGEIDCKDSGWLVLGGVVRILLYGSKLGEMDLGSYCRKWTLASVRVDDTRSAWTTFALLLALDLSGGIKGFYHSLFSSAEQQELKKFFLQIDIRELLAASRNYHIAAAVIDILRCRFGYLQKPFSDPDADIEYLLEGYLGEGFFNDDDGRGSREDRRIDAYSGEIIGLLLNYDSIFPSGSPFREKLHSIIRNFCAANIYLTDRNGEYGKWGRSLRGEAEIKKVFLWEYAEKHHLTAAPGDGAAVSEKLIDFFEHNGIGENGRISRDKAADRGIWDEYTTIVQAQGYGIYGLAMACLYAADTVPERPLPAETESYVKYLPHAGIVCTNHAPTGVHYIIPASNRMTKNMFFWHNRLTGECNVEVDVSAKFQPVPYAGKMIPTPYSGPELPFLPMLENAAGELLIPRGLDAGACSVSADHTGAAIRRSFRYCRPASYEACSDLSAETTLLCCPGKITIQAKFNGTPPAGFHPVIFVFEPAEETLRTLIDCAGGTAAQCSCAPSIYGASTRAAKIAFENVEPINCDVQYIKN